VNQSQNTSTNLTVGNYTYFASAKDSVGNENRSEVRTIQITSAGGGNNRAPTNYTNIFINSTNGNNKTAQDLFCYTNITDSDNNKINVTVRWFKNATLNVTIDYNNSYANNTLFNVSLHNGNTTKHEIWNCALRLYDGTDHSSFINSTNNLTVINTLPVVNLLFPANGNATTNRTPTFNWSGNDDDNDILSYEINLTAYYTGGGRRQACDLYKNNNSIGTVSNFTPGTGEYLKCLIDNGYYFNWTVRAYDGDGFGGWNATERNITIQSFVSVTLPVNVVNFSTKLNLSNQRNTSADDPAPFIIRNTGNVETNVSINFTNPWTSISLPNESLRFKVRNLTAGCFIFANTTTSWTHAPTATTPIIHRLNFTSGYQAGCDNSSLDIHIKVPLNEPSGSKSSVVTFIGDLGEPGYGAD
jgi:hypothetical protein